MNDKETIFSIVERLDNLQALIDDETVTAEQVADALVQVEGDLAKKGDAYIAKAEDFTSKIEYVDMQIKRMQAYKKYLQNSKARFDGGLLFALDKLGRKEILAGIGKISWQNNPPALEILNEHGIPAEYLTVVPEQVIPEHIEVNKAALKKALVEDKKAGGTGELMFGEALAARVTQGRRVVIK